MIISTNKKPALSEFQQLMRDTDIILNNEAKLKEEYFFDRNGTLLETDVYDALLVASQNTSFESSIKLISGASFPDIVASGFYGIEVKSTKSNTWKSIGSSILESTRLPDVERIYLTFGKLGSPVEFRSRPYEECLCGISVTHYPRYQIDMELSKGKTIFDQLGIPYDTLRKMDNPVKPVAQYYKSRLSTGESLWWATDSDIEATSSPLTVKHWNVLSAEEKTKFTVMAYALFPEILGASTSKYDRYALWLVTHHGIVNTHIRDQFTAGGRVSIRMGDKYYDNLPGYVKRIVEHYDEIAQIILTSSDIELMDHWDVLAVQTNRISQWCRIAANIAAGCDKYQFLDLLQKLFGDYINGYYGKSVKSTLHQAKSVQLTYTRDNTK